MSKYVFATYFTPDTTDPEELDCDGYISIAPANDFSGDQLDEDISVLGGMSTDALCQEDECNFSIPTGGRAAALALLAAHPDLVTHSPEYQAYCRQYDGVYGWKAD